MEIAEEFRVDSGGEERGLRFQKGAGVDRKGVWKSEAHRSTRAPRKPLQQREHRGAERVPSGWGAGTGRREEPGQRPSRGEFGSRAGKGRQPRESQRGGRSEGGRTRARGRGRRASCGTRLCVSSRQSKWELKIGFLLGGLLVVGGFLGLVVGWSSLCTRLEHRAR